GSAGGQCLPGAGGAHRWNRTPSEDRSPSASPPRGGDDRPVERGPGRLPDDRAGVRCRAGGVWRPAAPRPRGRRRQPRDRGRPTLRPRQGVLDGGAGCGQRGQRRPPRRLARGTPRRGRALGLLAAMGGV
ncbi:MAG: hypothetical protein AVDCRST_MAG19-1663, partial [uncultured Thermomicrobiales bacterium]